jgi:hypothetical protein
MTRLPSARRPLRLLALFVAVCVITLAWEYRQEPEPVDPPLLKLAAHEVVAVRVQMGVRRLDAVRDRGGWRIVDPPGSRPAASAAVATLVDAIVAIVPVAAFERQQVDRDALGLDTGHARIEIDTEKSRNTAVLVLGDYVPTGGSVYAALASDPRIFQLGALIISEIEAAFHRALRDDAGATRPVDGAPTAGADGEH